MTDGLCDLGGANEAGPSGTVDRARLGRCTATE